MNPNIGTLRIGTSNIALPGSKETFPIEFQNKSRLHYYSTLFNTLEVNSTFKKVPLPSTLQKWSGDVPAGFQFTIKAWKDITHAKQVSFNPADITTFLSAVNHIGVRKGCLLIQFPGSITFEYYDQVSTLLRSLEIADGENKWRKAIEFRSATWYNSETYQLLDSLNACIVLHDMPKSQKLQHEGDALFSYYRFHGPRGDYRGSYTDGFLSEQAENIRRLLTQGTDVYVYFNNTMGNAYENAMQLKMLIEGNHKTTPAL